VLLAEKSTHLPPLPMLLLLLLLHREASSLTKQRRLTAHIPR